MFRRILIANRGEVVARVLQTCAEMDIEGVIITTEADQSLGFVQDAEHVANIGGTRAYLDLDAVLGAATESACSAIHPGWGFLSENPTFAARCESLGLTFVGPSSATMRRMADKAAARRTMAALGVPTIPGSEGALKSIEEATEVAQKIGYPVLLKAVSGGGGRGMRIVRQPEDLSLAYDSAGAEALGAFGDGRLYVEKLIENGRHIEFQIVGDGETVQVLGERECSIQRRHQKLLEETPSPALRDASGLERKARVTARLKGACEAIGYRGAGTVEMLMDSTGELYFMEMNTRLQVEHTITEMVTGVDLVRAQLEVASNRRLDAFPAPTGFAIQCRINAENPGDDFKPQPGLLERFELPHGPGVRVDTHLREGDRVSAHYDSMIAKVITHGASREEAIDRMCKALDEMVVEGVPTTIPVHKKLLRHPEFIAGATDTGLLERELGVLLS